MQGEICFPPNIFFPLITIDEMDTESKCNFATIAELCQSGDKEKEARESWFGSPCKTEDCNSTTDVKEKQPHGDESLNSSQGECPICAAFFSLNNIEAHVEECIVASEAKEIREAHMASSKVHHETDALKRFFFLCCF